MNTTPDERAVATLSAGSREVQSAGVPLAALPLSQVLRNLDSGTGDRITVAEVAQLLSHRGLSAMLIFLAAPNLLPLPPGSSTVLGIPLILISVHLIAGRNRLTLPQAIAGKSFDRRLCARVAQRLGDLFERIERLARPRFWVLPVAATERLVGTLTLLMALILIFPIPLGNVFPAFAIVAMNLGFSERDSVWLCGGVLIAAMSVGIVLGVIRAAGIVAASLM